MVYQRNIVKVKQFREKQRRQFERRHAERREPLEFGSEEWLRKVQTHHEMWPKKDRRSLNRRGSYRRTVECRRNLEAESKQNASFAEDILSQEEKDALLEP